MLLIFSSLLQSGGGSGPSSWPIARAWLLAPSRILPALDFNPVAPATRVPFTLDFASEIPIGDSLASVGVSTLAACHGADPDAGALLWGAAHISGTKVTQWAGPGWVAGVTYILTLSAVTAAGAQLPLCGRIACKALN